MFVPARTDNRLWEVPITGGELHPLTPLGAEATAGIVQSRDGQEIFYLERRNGLMNIWAMPARGGRQRQLTDLTGRRGAFGYTIATDGESLYFTWREDLGDIWVMDVVQDDGSDDRWCLPMDEGDD